MYEYNAYIITGGTGFIGKQIVKKLIDLNQKVYVFTRQKMQSNHVLLHYVQWDPTKRFIAHPIPESNVCIIHLAGTNVSEKRWSNKQKQLIQNSRVDSSKFLYALIKNGNIKASYLVSASAIGIYGERDKIFTEEDTPSTDFLGSTCLAWENEVRKINELNLPVGILRLGLVLGLEGGAAKEFLKTLKFKIAGVPADGKQVYSWLHIYDATSAFLFACSHQLNDTYNTVAPNVCSANELISGLGKYFCANRYVKIFIPSFILKLVLGEFSIEILKSAAVSSKKLEAQQFSFTYDTIDKACKALHESR